MRVRRDENFDPREKGGFKKKNSFHTRHAEMTSYGEDIFSGNLQIDELENVHGTSAVGIQPYRATPYVSRSKDGDEVLFKIVHNPFNVHEQIVIRGDHSYRMKLITDPVSAIFHPMAMPFFESCSVLYGVNLVGKEKKTLQEKLFCSWLECAGLEHPTVEMEVESMQLGPEKERKCVMTSLVIRMKKRTFEALAQRTRASSRLFMKFSKDILAIEGKSAP